VISARIKELVNQPGRGPSVCAPGARFPKNHCPKAKGGNQQPALT
jgi:hypothetical protein